MRSPLFLLVLLVGCLVGDSTAEIPQNSASRPLFDGVTFNCSSVTIGPHQAMTAAHCESKNGNIAGSKITGFYIPNPLIDLAVVDVETELPPPYAVISTRELHYADVLYIQGFGCEPVLSGISEKHVLRERALIYRNHDQYNTTYLTRGRGCPGDSGSPVFFGGELVGIVWGISPGFVSISPVTNL